MNKRRKFLIRFIFLSFIVSSSKMTWNNTLTENDECLLKHYGADWWNIGNIDQDIQGCLFAILWWAVIVFNAYVGKFCFMPSPQNFYYCKYCRRRKMKVLQILVHVFEGKIETINEESGCFVFMISQLILDSKDSVGKLKSYYVIWKWWSVVIQLDMRK